MSVFYYMLSGCVLPRQGFRWEGGRGGEEASPLKHPASPAPPPIEEKRKRRGEERRERERTYNIGYYDNTRKSIPPKTNVKLLLNNVLRYLT